jgi:chromosomal replication initiation ATPase DnaA
MTRYLKNYIAQGGSKVKLLVGGQGTGKTHLLRVVLADGKN